MTTPLKGKADYLELGDHNAVCYECGRKFKASQLKRHWQGYYVCERHWEARHPQDFVRGVQDIQTPPWTQPMPADTFVSVVPAPIPPEGALSGTVYKTVLDTYILSNADAVIKANATAFPFTIFLPNPATANIIHRIQKIDVTGHIVTVSGNGNLFVGGNVSLELPSVNGVDLLFNGTFWEILNAF